MFVNTRGRPFDKNGTGTAAAGIVGAIHNNGKGIKGINGKVSMIPVRFIDSNGRSRLTHLVSSLNYALTRNVDLVLLHMPQLVFGSGLRGAGIGNEVVNAEKQSLAAVLNKFLAKDIPIVLNAGNSGRLLEGPKNGVLEFIAEYKNTIVVTSIDKGDRRPFVANYGMSVVDLAAPGIEILSTAIGSKYRQFSGTYIAAAHVAGAIALARSIERSRTPTPLLLRKLLSAQAGDSLNSLSLETVSGVKLNIAKFLSTL